MSLDTLLEAARYLELQELKERQQRESAAPQASPPILHPPAAVKQELTSLSPQPSQRIIQNSFDIINPLVIDEGGEQKRKQPPLVFRSGTREVHNKLEKHRRAHLKECFDFLKKQLPTQTDEKKTSNLSILHSALRHIQSLKRKERELEHEMERLAREKISAQQRLAVLKKEISAQCDNVDFNALLPEVPASPAVTEPKPADSGPERVPIPPLPRPQLSVQLPVGYPPGLVLHKVALVPKGIADLVSTHLFATPQQLGGKVVPLVNAQYLVKPLVVVSSPSITPRPS